MNYKNARAIDMFKMQIWKFLWKKCESRSGPIGTPYSVHIEIVSNLAENYMIMTDINYYDGRSI